MTARQTCRWNTLKCKGGQRSGDGHIADCPGSKMEWMGGPEESGSEFASKGALTDDDIAWVRKQLAARAARIAGAS